MNQVNKFDAAFFGVHYKQAHTMDPMCRIILEKSYEAIVDSGNKLTNSIQLYSSILFIKLKQIDICGSFLSRIISFIENRR